MANREKEIRESREKTPGIDFLSPINLSKIGTQDDPCFGKFPDLNAEECRDCGDCELCQVAYSQRMNLERVVLEKKTHFKDIEREKENVKAFYKEALKKHSRSKAKILTKKHFNIDKETLQSWI